MKRSRSSTGGARRSATTRTTSELPRARKRFGQHFLEPAWVARLIDAVDPAPSDTFLEIGPGRGALTIPLARRVSRIIGIELDRDLAARMVAIAPPNVHIVQGDVLRTDLDALLRSERRPIRAIGNLPYNVASPILFRLLDTAAEGRQISDAIVMLQKEVADRVAAIPGERQYGALAIQVALRADVERLLTLPPGAFRPAPKVTSAVVRLRFRTPNVDIGDQAVFERVVRGLFLQRRKTLGNALKPVAESLGHVAAEVIARSGLDGSKRPEMLTLPEIARLVRAVL